MLVAACICTIVAYWPYLSLPFISDDYVQLTLGRDYGPVSGWNALLHDALYRCRATSIFITHWTTQLFGLTHAAYSVTSLLLHLVNCMLVFALGAWRVFGYRVSAFAALIFGVYEVHQEAVVWYSALPELLVFTFSVASLVCFIHATRSARPPGWYCASFVLYVFALASKESAVVVVPLAAWALWSHGMLRRRWKWLIPFAATALAYTGLVFASASSHLHFNDAGTFSLRAPFWFVLSHSAVRALWLWGAVPLIVLYVYRTRRTKFQVLVAVAWILITLLPYSFLTYMSRVPSRHLYFAAVGVAMIMASALLARPGVLSLLVLIGFVSQNTVYLHTRKFRQFEERAAITENLLQHARASAPPLYLSCFPYSPVIAEYALKIRFNRPAVATVEDGERPGLNLCTKSHFAQATKGKTIRLDW